eukprot:TRINITY_DN4646_c0_g4_i1.p2 TRINITY_DN4646_c0_g4~~TRINITY_DN4646_c0_g4_i1.p2  ORF type:complete len:121 (+),score=3.63 TRINITY_DN4646_c0_g4_i1:120-482(+)
MGQFVWRLACVFYVVFFLPSLTKKKVRRGEGIPPLLLLLLLLLGSVVVRFLLLSFFCCCRRCCCCCCCCVCQRRSQTLAAVADTPSAPQVKQHRSQCNQIPLLLSLSQKGGTSPTPSSPL